MNELFSPARLASQVLYSNDLQLFQCMKFLKSIFYNGY